MTAIIVIAHIGFILWFWVGYSFGKKRSKEYRKPVLPRKVPLCLDPEDMNEWQITDVIVNGPFITLTESKMVNAWYHHDERIDCIFMLGPHGFKVCRVSRAELKQMNLFR